ncbi:hypothetical protein [Undibacterium sp. Ji49W]|uniref:hypothetical protein n=1 Tax=Undibacterium sp. Ji49W TaxID=3413040 RepID=UPI003BF2A923
MTQVKAQVKAYKLATTGALNEFHKVLTSVFQAAMGVAPGEGFRLTIDSNNHCHAISTQLLFSEQSIPCLMTSDQAKDAAVKFLASLDTQLRRVLPPRLTLFIPTSPRSMTSAKIPATLGVMPEHWLVKFGIDIPISERSQQLGDASHLAPLLGAYVDVRLCSVGDIGIGKGCSVLSVSLQVPVFTGAIMPCELLAFKDTSGEVSQKSILVYSLDDAHQTVLAPNYAIPDEDELVLIPATRFSLAASIDVMPVDGQARIDAAVFGGSGSFRCEWNILNLSANTEASVSSNVLGSSVRLGPGYFHVLLSVVDTVLELTAHTGQIVIVPFASESGQVHSTSQAHA